MVRSNEDESGWTPDELYEEIGHLRRIAGLNIIRAAHIADTGKDEEVALMLVSEASVMLSVATKVEQLFEPKQADDDL